MAFTIFSVFLIMTTLVASASAIGRRRHLAASSICPPDDSTPPRPLCPSTEPVSWYPVQNHNCIFTCSSHGQKKLDFGSSNYAFCRTKRGEHGEYVYGMRTPLEQSFYQKSDCVRPKGTKFPSTPRKCWYSTSPGFSSSDSNYECCCVPSSYHYSWQNSLFCPDHFTSGNGDPYACRIKKPGFSEYVIGYKKESTCYVPPVRWGDHGDTIRAVRTSNGGGRYKVQVLCEFAANGARVRDGLRTPYVHPGEP